MGLSLLHSGIMGHEMVFPQLLKLFPPAPLQLFILMATQALRQPHALPAHPRLSTASLLAHRSQEDTEQIVITSPVSKGWLSPPASAWG